VWSGSRAEGEGEILTDNDPIAAAMQEAQRLITEPVGPNPFDRQPAVDAAREILEPKPNPTIEIKQPAELPLTTLPLDTAIRFRWALRDIKGKRTKFTPVSPGDLRTLLEMGLVEMRDELPVLTNEGERAIDWS
jgi:hypothetical protein